MKTTRIWPLLALLALVGSGAARAETITFDDPMGGRYRLDYCRYEGQDCGVAAAFAFCQQRGYQQIEDYQGERDVTATTRIGDGSTCRSNEVTHCDGFASITCSRDHAPPALRPGSPDYPVRPYTGDSEEDVVPSSPPPPPPTSETDVDSEN
jgi:hypothetical protein